MDKMSKMGKNNNVKEKGAEEMESLMCFECGEEDSYEIREVEREYIGDGYNFTLQVKVPFCCKCGAPIVCEELEDEIATKANERIRESRAIIKREEIIEILSKYDVSQKFMSRMLGWGEITLTRYINNNYTPNIANSNKLKSINDPYVFSLILNKKIEDDDASIQEEPAFHKLKNNINKQIDELEKKEGKIFKVVNWFLSQSTEDNKVTHLALQKLLYFSQAWSYVLNDEWLFEDDCEAWAHGAVYHNVYDEFKKFKYNALPVVDKEIDLSTKEIEVLEFVKEYYFDVYTAKTLENICHLEEPYKTVRKNYTERTRSGDIIKKTMICDYYTQIATVYNISKNSKENVKVYLNDLLLGK